jgi:hypothetical protein
MRPPPSSYLAARTCPYAFVRRIHKPCCHEARPASPDWAQDLSHTPCWSTLTVVSTCFSALIVTFVT